MPPADEESRILDPCPNCATLIDVSATEPFSEIHCPICGTLMRVRTQFNNFALQKIIGEGGMGTVFEAIDLNLQRPVAVKILKKEYSADEASITQLETEARITASISHPHVVKVFSAGRDHGQFYLAMELVGRGTLDQLMNLQGRVAEAQVLDVGMQVADGLRAAAQIGLIHRDVKPGNILFADSHTAKVVDFGLAILMEDEAKTRGEIWGTPYYVAPEKLNNEPEDFRSDIYSLGGTLFHALSGRPPFEAASASLVALKHLKSQAVSLQAFAPDVSNETAFVINRMLHKDPLQRYQSYDELIEHLKYAKTQLLERTATGVKPKTRVIVESDATRSFTAWITVGLLILMIGMGVYVWSKRATLFGNSDLGTGTAVAAKVASSDTSVYEEGLEALTKGKADEAITLFDEFASAANAPQPLRNWALFQKGLALNLNGQASDAREVYAGLQTKGLYSEESGEIKLASFFVETGRLMKSPGAIPGSIKVAYGTQDFEAMGLLAFALKNWAMADFANAGPLLEKFCTGKPDNAYLWIEKYKTLAENYLADYKLYDEAATQIANAKTPTQKAAAFKFISDSASQLKTVGALPARFDSWEAALKKELGVAQQKAEQVAADSSRKLIAADAARWSNLQKSAAEPVRGFSPEKILTSVKSAEITSDPLRKKKAELQKQIELLLELKEKIIAAVRPGSYNTPVKNRAGGVVPGIVSRATADTLYIKTNYGETAVPWKDVSTASIADIAEKLVVDSNPSHKKWLIGGFQTLCGDAALGKEMLIEAAQSDETLRDRLTIFFPESS